MTEKTIKVSYQFASKGTFLGEMEVPVSAWNGADPTEDWTSDVEKYILENHNFFSQPAEFDFEFEDVDFFDVDPTQ